MTVKRAPRFEKRRVLEWLELAEQGKIALPSFQRGYVWRKNQSIADYLHAVFENRPTGVFLVLKTNGTPQFESRSLKGMSVEPGEAEELLLDGQQRLTSLWAAFNGSAAVQYYVKVASLKGRDVSVVDVVFWSDGSAKGQRVKLPKNAYVENLVPVAILRDESTSGEELGQIWEWCRSAVEDPDEARRLEKTINRLQKEVLLQRDLHYCELDADTDRETAIEIFVQSNESSVKVNEFDIAVALALDKGDEKLRDRIGDFNRQSDVIRHYFARAEEDEEAVIAPLGEWLLFSACMTVKGTAPKKAKFEDLIRDVFGPDGRHPDRILGGLLSKLEKALNTLSSHGAATRELLPAVPPLHVLTSLQDELKGLGGSARGNVNSLISAYLWRSFFTDRYEAKANDRLFEDYIGLKKSIASLKKNGKLGTFDGIPIFDVDENPLPDAATMGNLAAPAVPWIGTSRLGRAVAAMSLCATPMDWATGDRLDEKRLRELRGENKLDRHHIFPQHVLKQLFGSERDSRPIISHGLNGVVLAKSTNNEFWRKPPAEYLDGILQRQPNLKERTLKARVESHLVPYDVLTKGGGIEQNYRDFIESRAQLVAKRINELAEWPGDSAKVP